ncbi:unnamed protein product [Kuraishia capsulata CBS 1993]|uniref:EF-hand domain-containing protein n=1 Tax=Kuraishia capsulata CBS 1993 TaxID=1382522 RepID=W6MI16_9ASCO|nr:uncharacterized protein KUCA_T00001985001 [Kuraishia capsulata CBS 1993]CDK26014.1 unnamed protein product [Kuraishia capsulata CBS 1993]
MLSTESEDEKLQRHRKLFLSIDNGKSGQISLKSFRESLKSQNHPLKDSQYAIGELFQSLDTDGDHLVDFDNFRRYVLQAEQQIEAGFRVLDKDEDGKILKSDVEKYLKTTLGVDPAPEEVDVFFESLDNGHRGYVSYEEFRDTLLLMPRLQGSRIKTAFRFFNDELENLSSEGDVTVGDDILNSVGYFLAGGLSGVVSRTCTAPFDRVKVFLIARTDLTSTFLHSKEEIRHIIEEQKHQELAESKIKSPIIKAARSLYRQGGLKAFYVGNGLNVIKVFPESAIKFGSFEAAKRFMCKFEGVSDPSELSRLSTYSAGGLAGVVAQMAVYPIDTLKFRIQCAPLESRTKGGRLLFTTAKDMYKEGGIRLFYRGLIVGIGGMFPYAALDLGTFTTIKKYYIQREAERRKCSEDDVKLPNYLVLSMGALSGSFGATVVYPINLLRTRLQAQGTFAHPYRYDGFFDVARQTIKREGFPGLFKGLVPNLAKVAPAVSISYLVYENLKGLFGLEVK